MSKPLPRILALDIATHFGWAYGIPGETPRGGAKRFAVAGASNGLIGRGCLNWFVEFLKVSPVDALYFEAPFDPRQMGDRTTFATARVLIGLPFLIETLAEAKSIFRVRECMVGDVRKHFTGRNARGDDGKASVQLQCRALGWSFSNDNEADAKAVWSYACSIEAPGIKPAATTPLFSFRPKSADPAPAATPSGRPSSIILPDVDEKDEIPF